MINELFLFTMSLTPLQACDIYIPANTRLVGPLIIEQTPDCTEPLLTIDGPNVQIVGLTLIGNSNSREFTEGAHLISAKNADDLYVQGNMFENITGDGLIVWSGDNVTVAANTFVGASDGDYRNWISLIDTHHVHIIGNTLWTPSVRMDMPGGITLEPDTDSQSVTDVMIERNVFINRSNSYESAIQIWTKPWWRKTKALVERVNQRRNILVGNFQSMMLSR